MISVTTRPPKNVLSWEINSLYVFVGASNTQIRFVKNANNTAIIHDSKMLNHQKIDIKLLPDVFHKLAESNVIQVMSVTYQRYLAFVS